ncbi:hypothetical protein, conserved [Plasmodium gonderi]|uniref:Protein HGH1 N-terminal domain-containing protein n=1 Tax=Plasmodium gonderi TaxID=77519 RepID=A0A1Y1JNE6_PLAGO|nr:hypothetical protein, conserved [Plasmodium gonderi]GAW82975.1 hypothetical protein, conserved [Plasmodium gonderi]
MGETSEKGNKIDEADDYKGSKKGENNLQVNDSLYDELFSLITMDNDIVKKESFKILLSLIEEKSLVNYIKKNNQKCMKVFISALSYKFELLALQCLLNLSAQIPMELIERNIIEVIFDIIREEEQDKEKDTNLIEIYIMILANLSREKTGIYKILDLTGNNEDEERNEEELAVSYYLNKLLHFFFLPIKASLSRNLDDKYLFISHILINVTSIKECAPFFKSIPLLNKLSNQILVVERFKAILPCIINLCQNETLYEFVFHEDCNMMPFLLSYVYTNDSYALSNSLIYIPPVVNDKEDKDAIHHLIVQKATILISCTRIKSRIIILLWNLYKRKKAREIANQELRKDIRHQIVQIINVIIECILHVHIYFV